MKRPIDRFKGKSREEIEAKEDLLDRDNLESCLLYTSDAADE